MIDALREASGRAVSRETYGRLEAYVDLLQEESGRQNLVSTSTLASVWERHVLDSAQLAGFGPSAAWVDIGSGAGLPGIVIALLSDGPMTLIEPRRLRAEFLSRCLAELDLGSRVTVVGARAEAVTGKFAVITGRAVAPLDKFLRLAAHLSHSGTTWVLPKGRKAQSELAEARRNWQCEARLEPSRTDPDSTILVLTNVRTKAKP